MFVKGIFGFSIEVRKRFKTESLKNSFTVAWAAIPEDISRNLSPFIRQVREVDKLSGTYIGCPDGTRYGPLESGTGYTFFYKDINVAFCDIILPATLSEATQAQLIAVILHELSHAWNYCQNHEVATEGVEIEGEIRAWRQAAAWARLGISDSELASEVASEASVEELGRMIGLLQKLLYQIEQE